MPRDAPHSAGLSPTEAPVNLAGHEALAQARLDERNWAYLQGGAGDEITLRDNQAAWQRRRLWPRVLRDLTGGHTRCELLGRTLAHPVLLAPVAYQRLAHPDGELATALAAAAQGAGFVLSSQSSVAPEAVAELVRDDPGRGPLWFQLYLQHDRGFNRELVQRIEALGYEALVLTVDAPVQGPRDRERAAGFRLPAEVDAAPLRGLPPRPRASLGVGQSALFDDLLHAAPRWSDLDWLAGQSRLPILLKGILHVDDARTAAAAGVAGLIVSNHGGRTLDTAPATADVLADVVQALGSGTPVLVDGGIRRGTDVLKALALGARAVLIGRPQVHGLATAGAQGVAHVIRLLRDELEAAMALTGCRMLADASAALIRPDGPRLARTAPSGTTAAAKILRG